jgi:hypothetical protein
MFTSRSGDLNLEEEALMAAVSPIVFPPYFSSLFSSVDLILWLSRPFTVDSPNP